MLQGTIIREAVLLDVSPAAGKLPAPAGGADGDR